LTRQILNDTKRVMEEKKEMKEVIDLRFVDSDPNSFLARY
jgi:hypothetical protein